MMNLEHVMATMLPLSAAEATVLSKREPQPWVSDLVSQEVCRWVLDPKLTHAMAKLYRPLAPLVERYQPGLWVELVREYAAHVGPETPSLHIAGEGFVRFVEGRRLRGAEQPRWIEECAEYLACQLRCASCENPEAGSDGLERRVFIRRYRCDVDRLLTDPRRCELPRGGDEACTRVIYRSLVDGDVHVFEPRPVHLFAVSRRALVPNDLGGMTASFLDEAERWLIARGVLTDERGRS